MTVHRIYLSYDFLGCEFVLIWNISFISNKVVQFNKLFQQGTIVSTTPSIRCSGKVKTFVYQDHKECSYERNGVPSVLRPIK